MAEKLKMKIEEKAWAKVSQWVKQNQENKLTETSFREFIRKKAAALWKRDKKKLIAQSSKESSEKYDDSRKRAEYRNAIYKAIVAMKENVCPYTGYILQWEKIGTWKNDEAKSKGKKYKKDFAYLPTVDHINADPKPDFIICSWVANDAKNDLTKEAFVKLCRDVVAFADK